MPRQFTKKFTFHQKTRNVGIHIKNLTNCPCFQTLVKPKTFVHVSVWSADVELAASSTTVKNGQNPVWESVLSLPDESTDAPSSLPLPGSWDLQVTVVRVELLDATANKVVGTCNIPLLDLVRDSETAFLLWDAEDNGVCNTEQPYEPCKVHLSLVETTLPTEWLDFVCEESERYEHHVFMMTRGTRGDVQPFVALARGMAQEHGWLITICTEMVWKSFVLGNADVSRGKIQFRPSGGNTEGRLGTNIAKWATNHTSEFIQMSILASAEAEFFPSTTVFLDQLRSFEHHPRVQPVDVLVYGLTVVGVALTIGEVCSKPIIGFILQPSIIPSTDKSWTAVQPIETHKMGILDRVEEKFFTSHGALSVMKSVAENNPFTKFTLNSFRKSVGLRPILTWTALRTLNAAMVVPMKASTFPRPSDWWENVLLTDFIFLRSATTSLGGPLGEFVRSAQANGSKLVLMTFSSMLVSRQMLLRNCVKMLQECRFDMRLIYVGKRQPDEVPADLSSKVEVLKRDRFLEIEKADFGVLFQHIDAFIVHGGLGTTVEALRMKKPCVVTGPLLMDQRFWGTCCSHYGVGPEPQHIAQFEHHCVPFVEGALDPLDPMGWQSAAAQLDMGDVTDDGVEINVAAFHKLLRQGLPPPPMVSHSYLEGFRVGTSMYDISGGVQEVDEEEVDEDEQDGEDHTKSEEGTRRQSEKEMPERVSVGSDSLRVTTWNFDSTEGTTREPILGPHGWELRGLQPLEDDLPVPDHMTVSKSSRRSDVKGMPNLPDTTESSDCFESSLFGCCRR